MFGLSLEQRGIGCKKKFSHAKAQRTQRILWQKIKTITQKASRVMLCELSGFA
jgi:hypothetical protein